MNYADYYGGQPSRPQMLSPGAGQFAIQQDGTRTFGGHATTPTPQRPIPMYGQMPMQQQPMMGPPQYGQQPMGQQPVTQKRWGGMYAQGRNPRTMRMLPNRWMQPPWMQYGQNAYAPTQFGSY